MAPLKRRSPFLLYIKNAQFSFIIYGKGLGLIVKTVSSHPAEPGSIPGDGMHPFYFRMDLSKSSQSLR